VQISSKSRRKPAITHAKITSFYGFIIETGVESETTLHCMIRFNLLRLQFPCLGADIKFIEGYVAGDIDDKGGTGDKTVGFETNDGNCLLASTYQLMSPTFAWGKRSKRRAS